MDNDSNDSCSNYPVDPLEPLYCEAPDWVPVLQALYLSFVMLGSVIGNGLILLLIACYKELRYRSVLVSLTTVITELLFALIYILPGVSSLSAQKWIFGHAGCEALGFIGFYLIYVRWMSMAVISMDRFVFIVFPFRYNQWSKPFLVCMTVVTWLLPAIMHSPSILGIGRYTYRTSFSQCIIDCEEDTTCYGLHVAIFSSQMTIGMLLPMILYSILLYISYVKRRQIVMGTQENERGSRWSLSLSWSRQNTQILISYLLIFVTLAITNLPVFILTILRRGFSEIYANLPLWVHLILADLFYFSSILTPLFIMRNRDFKKALKRLMRRGSKLCRRCMGTSATTSRRTSVVRRPPTNMDAQDITSSEHTTQQINDEIDGFMVNNNINQVETIDE